MNGDYISMTEQYVGCDVMGRYLIEQEDDMRITVNRQKVRLANNPGQQNRSAVAVLLRRPRPSYRQKRCYQLQVSEVNNYRDAQSSQEKKTTQSRRSIANHKHSTTRSTARWDLHKTVPGHSSTIQEYENPSHHNHQSIHPNRKNHTAEPSP